MELLVRNLESHHLWTWTSCLQHTDYNDIWASISVFQ